MSLRPYIDLIESQLSHPDAKDALSFDVPFLIRIMEFVRENCKSDEQLHKFVERLLSMKGRTLTMDDYDEVMRGIWDPDSEKSSGGVEEEVGFNPASILAGLGEKASENGEAACRLVDDQEPIVLVVAKAKMGMVRFYMKSLDKDRRKTKHFSLNPTMAMDAKRAAGTLEMVASKAAGRVRPEGEQVVDESPPSNGYPSHKR